MTPEKRRRVAMASGFLSGVLACTDAVRDAKVVWPLNELWAGLRNPHRVELAGGVAVIIVTLVISAVRKKATN